MEIRAVRSSLPYLRWQPFCIPFVAPPIRDGEFWLGSGLPLGPSLYPAISKDTGSPLTFSSAPTRRPLSESACSGAAADVRDSIVAIRAARVILSRITAKIRS